tara:strand:+ start:100 stop:276 length:177 start_codon:yes stop_codon:yes gene_type:complete
MNNFENPLESQASVNDAGEMEVTIAKKYSEAEAALQKEIFEKMGKKGNSKEEKKEGKE